MPNVNVLSWVIRLLSYKKEGYMVKTKKVNSSGRFGVRYGLSIRKDVLAVDKMRRGQKKCPSCLKNSVKRQSAGIWSCGSCGLKVAGRAYQIA